MYALFQMVNVVLSLCFSCPVSVVSCFVISVQSYVCLYMIGVFPLVLVYLGRGRGFVLRLRERP